MLDILQFEFMQRAFLAGTLVAILAPLLGIFIVVRRYSPLADSLAHVSLVGVAIALVTNTSTILFAGLATILASLGIEKIRSTQKSFNDSILVLFTTGSLGFATIITSFNKGLTGSLDSFLFGSIATVSIFDIYIISAAFIAILTIMSLIFKQLFVLVFDEEIAQTNGIATKMLNYTVVVLAAITISISIRTVGALLISCLLIVPVISALQLKFNFKQTLACSIGISAVSVWSGLVISYYLNLASGGTIAVLNLVIFFFIYFWKKLD
jgi:zinc transport system permease protein